MYRSVLPVFSAGQEKEGVTFRNTFASSRQLMSKSKRLPDMPPAQLTGASKRRKPASLSALSIFFSFTPSQPPGATRPLDKIRQGFFVGIAPTLLPFAGNGLFTNPHTCVNSNRDGMLMPMNTLPVIAVLSTIILRISRLSAGYAIFNFRVHLRLSCSS